MIRTTHEESAGARASISDMSTEIGKGYIFMESFPEPLAQIDITPTASPTTTIMLYCRVNWWHRFWYTTLLGWKVKNL